MPYIGSKPSTANFSDLNGAKLILDADLFLMDDGASGTLRKTVASRLKTYIGGSDPASADGDTLGTASLEWSDLYLADGSVIYFGADQEIKVTHVADTGLTLKHTATADDKPISLTLQTGETDIAADDVIGAINFQAPDEGTGTDAILVAAGIEAVSEGDFSSSNNATKLSFKTGASEAAAEKMSLSSAGLLTVTGGVTMTGATPTLTIGDAGAEDTKIVFDGNAQDYYMGLDDTDDDLKIGLGSAVGTTAHMVFNEAGEILKPLQPCFGVYPTSMMNVAEGALTTIVFDTERFDVGSNFATNTFTAPITGKYMLCMDLYTQQVDSAAAYHEARIVSSNRNYYSINNTGGMDADGFQNIHIAAVVDMDASDTAYVATYIEASGTVQADILNISNFTGCLLV